MINPVVHWQRNYYLTAARMTNYNPAKCRVINFLKSLWVALPGGHFYFQFHSECNFAPPSPQPTPTPTPTPPPKHRHHYPFHLAATCISNVTGIYFPWGWEQIVQQGKVFLLSRHSLSALSSGDLASNASSHLFRHWKYSVRITTDKKHHLWKSCKISSITYSRLRRITNSFTVLCTFSTV